MVQRSANGCLSANTQDDDYFNNLESRTIGLFNDIYKSYIQKLPKNNNKQYIYNLIRDALSVFYKTYGYSFFKVQNKEDSFPPVMTILKDLDEHSRRCLAAAIGDTINNATPYQKETLEIWAKAFVITQMTSLDPLLTNFKQMQLKRKSFVLDTDFVLYSLTQEAKYSQEYHEILEYLLRLGCDIYIPGRVRDETRRCILNAVSTMEGIDEDSFLAQGDDYIHQRKTNAFLEDFIALRKDAKNNDLPFKSYISRYYHPQTDAFFQRKLKQLIGSENYDRDLQIEDIKSENGQKLIDILTQRTKGSLRGMGRTDFANEEIAEYDASLYLTLLHMNQKIENDELLPYSFYLLTKSTRTKYSAQQLGIYNDIICSPQALSVVLKELGEIKGNLQIINLFDNPFLAYLADILWDKTQPLLDAGVHLKHADVEVMRYDAETDFHEVLSLKSHEAVKALAYKYKNMGYTFADELVYIYEKNEQQASRISELEEENERLRKSLRKDRYKERVAFGIKNRKRKSRKK